MSIAALPYAVLLLVVEFAIGAQLCLFAIDVRGTAPRGLLKLGACLVVIATGLGLWLALWVSAMPSVDGYGLSGRYLLAARIALAVTLVLTACSAAAVWRGHRGIELMAGAATSVTALVVLGLLTALVQQPTSSLAGTYFGLLSGGLALGGVTLAMTLGHWYLVTPRLPERPLNEMTLGLLVVIAVQVLLLVLNVAAPGRHQLAPSSLTLGQNPAFWLRVGVGLALGGLLTFMAWQSSLVRGMMSATGLLYLATGAVMAGQALACALLFTTGIPS